MTATNKKRKTTNPAAKLKNVVENIDGKDTVDDGLIKKELIELKSIKYDNNIIRYNIKNIIRNGLKLMLNVTEVSDSVFLTHIIKFLICTPIKSLLIYRFLNCYRNIKL